MINYDAFAARILSTENSPQRFFIIAPNVPLSIYFGLNEVNQPTLLIEDVGDIFYKKLPTSTAQIHVAVYKKDEKVNLVFSLLSSEQREVFNLLCFDLFSSANKTTKEVALSSLFIRFRAWSDLLKGVRPAKLSVLQQQGLIAELLFLKRLTSVYGVRDVLHAWNGPLKADKDFIFGSRWFEVKSCKVDETDVSISSIEQLDSPQNGILYIYFIDKNTSETKPAFSLRDVVSDVRTLSLSDEERWVLERKLTLAGYCDDEPSYAEHLFRLERETCYIVRDDFPRLTREGLPSAIVASSYKLNLPAIKSFQGDFDHAVC